LSKETILTVNGGAHPASSKLLLPSTYAHFALICVQNIKVLKIFKKGRMIPPNYSILDQGSSLDQFRSVKKIFIVTLFILYHWQTAMG